VRGRLAQIGNLVARDVRAVVSGSLRSQRLRLINH
jgi:hypothetical protein